MDVPINMGLQARSPTDFHKDDNPNGLIPCRPVAHVTIKTSGDFCALDAATFSIGIRLNCRPLQLKQIRQEYHPNNKQLDISDVQRLIHLQKEPYCFVRCKPKGHGGSMSISDIFDIKRGTLVVQVQYFEKGSNLSKHHFVGFDSERRVVWDNQHLQVIPYNMGVGAEDPRALLRFLGYHNVTKVWRAMVLHSAISAGAVKHMAYN